MPNGFLQMKVCERTVALLTKSGIKVPMPVQERVIPALYAGKDVIVRAQTGTGKTLAYVIPLMEKLDAAKAYVQALIVAPTRELSLQVAAEIKKLVGDTGIRVLTVCGGRDFEEQKAKLGGKTQVIVGTPGRLLDHLRKGNTSLNGVKYVVLDEVDEMLNQGFEEDVGQLLELMPRQKQTVLCSATLSEEVRKLGKKLTHGAALIDVEPTKLTVDAIKQIAIKIDEEKKQAALKILIDRYNPYLMLIFCYSKERAIELADYLGTEQYNVDVLHGDMSQAKRKTVMKAFRTAKLQILVASDIAARGLDIEGVTHVINYDIPHDADWYVHRIGRTGRAGRDGIAVTLYTPTDGKWLKNIEEKLKVVLERQNLAGDVLAVRTRPAAGKPRPTAVKRDKNTAGSDKRGGQRPGKTGKQKGRGADEKGKSGESRVSNPRGKQVRKNR